MNSNQIFEKVQIPVPKGNWFNMSHDHKTTFNMGELIPFHIQEVMPADEWRINNRNLIRLAPLVAPAMMRADAIVSYFFVPSRILWDGWEDFITGGQDPSTAPAMPRFSDALMVTKGDLGHYMGLPPDKALEEGQGTPVSALPFAAYQKIWWEYYRDQNLQGEEQGYTYPELTAGATNDSTFWTRLRRRAWARDYYTAALPFAQKGAPVSIPITAQITGLANVLPRDPATPGVGEPTFRFSGSTTPAPGTVSGSAAGIMQSGASPSYLDPDGTLIVDGSELELGAIETTINDLRTAWALQTWLEKNATGGTRYIENLKVHFGTSPTDARLQRPEMIGSSFQRIVISEVLQTSETTDNSPLAAMGGHGISANSKGYFRYHAQEHGYIVGLVSILPEASYYQGLERMWTRESYFDYPWPDFARLGEQAVLRREVAAVVGPPTTARGINEGTFGYMPRYAEWRFKNSLTTGEFQPGRSLEHWTITRDLPATILSYPNLNDTFIECNPSRRIFASTDPNDHTIYAHLFNEVKVNRKLPKYGTPSKLS